LRIDGVVGVAVAAQEVLETQHGGRARRADHHGPLMPVSINATRRRISARTITLAEVLLLATINARSLLGSESAASSTSSTASAVDQRDAARTS
jgi:hypothetical protein